MVDIDLKILATELSIHNWSEIKLSIVCGCYHCCEPYLAKEIKEWIDEGETAVCPRCGIDMVIGDASGLPVGEPEFLQKLWGICIWD